MSFLHLFDMDGTLLRGTTASLEIARRLGCLTELVQLEASFASGALDTRAFARALCDLWGDLTIELVEVTFAEAPWIGGIASVLADIRARGEWSAVITMSPDFFARGLGSIGVDDVVASVFPGLPCATHPTRPAS